MELEKEKLRYKTELANPKKKDIDLWSYEFALFKANIKKFFPNIKYPNYLELFKKCLYHKWISGLEQFDVNYLKDTNIINNSSIKLDSKNHDEPLVFASFHFGSYRLYNSLLFEMGYKIVLIIDEGVYQRQENQLLNEVKPLLQANKTSDFVLLNVMDRTSIFKLKGLIEKGYVISVYLDGNTGINSDSQTFKKGFIPIKFLNQIIYVKNGIGKFAALLGATIVPTIAYRDRDERNHIIFHEQLKPESFNSKSEFSIKSIEQIYKLFEKMLIQDPMQWSSWLDIHRWLKRDYETPFEEINIKQKSQFKFNLKRYTLFKVKHSDFIFDLFDYRSYPINIPLKKAIENNDYSKIAPDLINELRIKNIIH